MRWFSLILILFTAGWCFAQELNRYEFSAPKMGTIFRIVVYHDDSVQVATAVRQVYNRIDSLNKIMSDYDPNSEINKLAAQVILNKEVFFSVSDDLWKVLWFARTVSRHSDGAFDITIGPLTRLWRRAFRRQVFPALSDVDEALSLVDYHWLKLRKRTQSICLKKPGMRIDLGGIAKGYAVDVAYMMLYEQGLNSVLVDGGGDIYAGDPPPGEIGWRIAQQKLQGDSLVNEIVYLKNGAIATSGDTYRFLDWEGKRYAHLINPKTGLGMTDRRIVTVRASNCMLADAMASVFSIIEFNRMTRLSRKFRIDVEILVKKNQNVWDTLRVWN